MADKMNYEAPDVRFLKLNGDDILTTSPGDEWDFSCQEWGNGNNRTPMECDITVHTDNSQN